MARGGNILMQHSVRAALMGIKVSAAHPVNGLNIFENFENNFKYFYLDGIGTV